MNHNCFIICFSFTETMSRKLFALILVSSIILEMCQFGMTWRRRRKGLKVNDPRAFAHAASELIFGISVKP